MVLLENLLSHETAAAEMRGVANENARVKDSCIALPTLLAAGRAANADAMGIGGKENHSATGT